MLAGVKIGELSQLTGVSTKTIRYYEGIDVLPEPARALNGYRDYGSEAVDRVEFVRDARATGLSLTEISTILSLRGEGESTCDHVLGLLQSHLEALDAQIGALRATRRQLASVTERARQLDPSDCTDPHRCQTIVAVGAVPGRSRSSHDHTG